MKPPAHPACSGTVLPGKDLPVPFNLSDSFIVNLQVKPFIIMECLKIELTSSFENLPSPLFAKEG